jgi:predicted lipoprotein with Yx(FWY)xxD motif
VRWPAGRAALRSRRPVPGLAAVFAALLALTGCGHSGPSASVLSAEPTLLAFPEPGVGPALTDPSGDTLYLFTRDRQHQISCTSACTPTWQPLVVPDGATARAGAGADAMLIGTIPSPHGGRQITYNHWPVYTYSHNLTTFSAAGNGIHYDGGTWWVITPQGQPAT